MIEMSQQLVEVKTYNHLKVNIESLISEEILDFCRKISSAHHRFRDLGKKNLNALNLFFNLTKNGFENVE